MKSFKPSDLKGLKGTYDDGLPPHHEYLDNREGVVKYIIPLYFVTDVFL